MDKPWGIWADDGPWMNPPQPEKHKEEAVTVTDYIKLLVAVLLGKEEEK